MAPRLAVRTTRLRTSCQCHAAAGLVRPWTLAFSDAAMEEKYATHTFANSAAVFGDLCALAMAANFLMFVWYLVANESGAVGGAAIVFISCGFGMVITAKHDRLYAG